MRVIEIHMLQTVPPSNINRDEDGENKSARFGGAIRQRVSSQAWKRPIRAAIQEELMASGNSIGTRSKLFAEKIKEQLILENCQGKDIDKVIKDLKLDENVLAYYSSDEIEAITTGIKKHLTEDTPIKDMNIKSIISEAKTRLPLDIALFGRMFASNIELNVNQAIFSNDAISTHEIETESDYFTAVDELKNTQGAGHLDRSAFTSSTLYRYFAIDIDQLQNNLGEFPTVAIPMILGAIVKAFPNGKRTSKNAMTRPAYVRIIIRDGQPQQLCDAFEKPVRPSENGFMEPSIKQIEEEMNKAITIWGSDGILYNERLSQDKPFSLMCSEVVEKISNWNKE